MDKAKELHEHLLSYPNVVLDFPFGKDVAVYKVKVSDDEWKMFALVPEQKTPLQISLKCAPELATLLREKYESIMAGYHLNKKHWNTMLLTEQLTDDEVQGLILHSYNLVTGNDELAPDFK
jgi:predicted DNA-binding protein (MmcQ/YjbR family)